MRSAREIEVLSLRLQREMAADGCLAWAREAVLEEITSAWARSKAGEEVQREALHAELRALDKVFRRLHGLLADRMIRDTEQQQH